MTDEEVNIAVARKLGWTEEVDNRKRWNTHTGIVCIDVPDFCHSIAAAWEIMEQNKDGFSLNCFVDGEWEAGFRMNEDNGISACAYTAPMAICLAFLKLSDEKK